MLIDVRQGSVDNSKRLIDPVDSTDFSRVGDHGALQYYIDYIIYPWGIREKSFGRLFVDRLGPIRFDRMQLSYEKKYSREGGG